METKREKDIIELLFSLWEAVVKYSNIDQRTDVNRASEEIAMKILNLLYDKQLEDLNVPGACGGLGERNFASVDLGWLGNEAYQVTSRTDKTKFDEDVTKFERKGLLQSFPLGIRFLILSSEIPSIKKSGSSDFSFFKPKDHIVTLPELARAVKESRNNGKNVYEEIKRLIADEFVPSLLLLMPEIQAAEGEREGTLRADGIFKIKMINRKINELQNKLRISTEDIFEFSQIDEICNQLNGDGNFENWSVFLTSMKHYILPVSQRLLLLDYNFDNSFLSEILSIENQLLSESIYDSAFYSAKRLIFPVISFQELLIHNRMLEVLNFNLEIKYQEPLKNQAENYRQKNYIDLGQWQ